MSEQSKDLNKKVKTYLGLVAAGSAATDRLQTTGLDASAWKRAKLVLVVGTCTDGGYTPAIHTSATVGGAYAAQSVANSEWTTKVAATEITSSNDETIYVYDIDLSTLDNRFVKVNIDETSAGNTGVVLSAVFEAELKSRPTS